MGLPGLWQECFIVFHFQILFYLNNLSDQYYRYRLSFHWFWGEVLRDVWKGVVSASRCLRLVFNFILGVFCLLMFIFIFIHLVVIFFILRLIFFLFFRVICFFFFLRIFFILCIFFFLLTSFGGCESPQCFAIEWFIEELLFLTFKINLVKMIAVLLMLLSYAL